MKFESLDDVFEAELHDLLSAEKQLVKALPSIADAASSNDLKTAVKEHLSQTEGHVTRLEKVFGSIDKTPKSEHCDGMEGLLKEGAEVAEADGDKAARDAAIIGAAQRVEHYEIAAYGTARALAEQLGHDEAVTLLTQTLDEESEADRKLTEVAKSVTVGAR
jgi:ferritin-like metal-binding protein YciE